MSSGAAPTHATWHIRDHGGKKTFWTEIGVDFTNSSRIALKLNLVPIDGGMILVQPLDMRPFDGGGSDWRDRDEETSSHV